MNNISELDVERLALACIEEKTTEKLLETAAREFNKIGFTGMTYDYIPHMGANDYKMEKTISLYIKASKNQRKEWIETYSKKYAERPDPLEEHSLKTGQAIWSGTLLDKWDFQSTEQQKHLTWAIETVGHFIIVPVFGPRRSRGILFLMTGDLAIPPSVRSMCFIEYICFFLHRQYCKIRASQHKDISLTPREKEVLQLIPLGRSNREIGLILGITANTVNGHIKQIFTKLDAPDRLTASLRGFTLDLID